MAERGLVRYTGWLESHHLAGYCPINLTGIRVGKSDFFEAHDIAFMQQALRLAERGLWSTAPNPRVGCVLVRAGQVLGQGWHARAGQNHAEIQAIENASESLQGATCYVTLEPCCHQGQTPPCVDQILAAGITEVVCASPDPNVMMQGRSFQLLQNQGVKVRVGLLQNQAERLNVGFFKRMRCGLPYIRLKIAMSLDGKIALGNGASQWITGAAARADVHLWRARSDAIISGVGTVNADNPLLTARPSPRADREPCAPATRVILDTNLSINPAAQVLHDAQPTILATAGGNYQGPDQPNKTVQQLPRRQGKVDLTALRSTLGHRGHNEVWVEAGSRLIGAFLEEGLFDELIVYIAPKILGSQAISCINGMNVERLADALELEVVKSRRLDQDICLELRRN